MCHHLLFANLYNSAKKSTTHELIWTVILKTVMTDCAPGSKSRKARFIGKSKAMTHLGSRPGQHRSLQMGVIICVSIEETPYHLALQFYVAQILPLCRVLITVSPSLSPSGLNPNGLNSLISRYETRQFTICNTKCTKCSF